MAHYTTTVRARATRGDAFRYLRDFSHAAEWDPSVARAERLDRGTPKRGARFDVQMKGVPGLPPLRFEYTLTRAERNDCLEFLAEGDRYRSLDVITFEDDPTGGCIVHYDADLRPLGPWIAFDLPIHLAFQWTGQGSAAGLKRALDGLRADAAPPARVASARSAPTR